MTANRITQTGIRYETELWTERLEGRLERLNKSLGSAPDLKFKQKLGARIEVVNTLLDSLKHLTNNTPAAESSS